MLIVIYPFDFTNVWYLNMNDLFRFALQISIFGMAIAMIVNFVQIFTGICKDPVNDPVEVKSAHQK